MHTTFSGALKCEARSFSKADTWSYRPQSNSLPSLVAATAMAPWDVQPGPSGPNDWGFETSPWTKATTPYSRVYKCPIRRREFGEKKCRSHSDQQKKGFPQRVYPPGKGQTPQRNFTTTTKWLKGKWALRENLPNRRLRPEEYSPPGKTRVPPPPPTPDGSLPAKIRNEALRRGNYKLRC